MTAGAMRVAAAPLAPTLSAMSILAIVWHFWVAVPLAAVSVVAILGTIGGYLAKVTYSRYPRD